MRPAEGLLTEVSQVQCQFEGGCGAWTEQREKGEHLWIAASTSGTFFHFTQPGNYPCPTSNKMGDSERKGQWREDNNISRLIQYMKQRKRYNEIIPF